MYKFCTHCGAKMPNENAFCTNCGAKFSQIPTPQQNIASTNINYNTSNSNTMPSYMHNQQTQQINIYSAIKMLNLYGYGLFVSGYGYIKTKCASTK